MQNIKVYGQTEGKECTNNWWDFARIGRCDASQSPFFCMCWASIRFFFLSHRSSSLYFIHNFANRVSVVVQWGLRLCAHIFISNIQIKPVVGFTRKKKRKPMKERKKKTKQDKTMKKLNKKQQNYEKRSRNQMIIVISLMQIIFEHRISWNYKHLMDKCLNARHPISYHYLLIL